ncbi:MAG: LL-diaminopimelate aminotransferase [Muribaculum sp.]|nr:LL-diaminopimelate aminotransferase [Muribaculum sp.]
MKINDNYRFLPKNYLFTEVGARIRTFRAENPDVKVSRMDIGDVTLPLPASAIRAMHDAVDDFGHADTFHGYGPEQGYKFLRKAIAFGDYRSRGITINEDEIFISDGAKSDLGNLGDLLASACKVALTDPGYPVYSDSNVIDGREGVPTSGGFSGFEYLECRVSTGFKPSLPQRDPDVVYLCYPNNPTGVALTREELKIWVDYALIHNTLIIYDSAYEAYISDPDIPHSIYEIEGAEKVAIEVRSFSKTAGFTGLRLGYTVVPKALKTLYSDGSEASLNEMWRRRQTTKFNGASYVIQRGAAALYTDEGREEVRRNVDYYMRNARILREGLASKGYRTVGGEHSPYVWFSAAEDADSWELFDLLLREACVSGTPGSGFGKCGQGWLRLTGFNTREETLRAMERIGKLKI